jgi:hypothetical protein
VVLPCSLFRGCTSHQLNVSVPRAPLLPRVAGISASVNC